VSSTQPRAGSQAALTRQKQNQKKKKGVFLPLQLPRPQTPKSNGNNSPGIVSIFSPISSWLNQTFTARYKKKNQPKPQNFLLYPLRLVKLPRLKEQIIGNIKHFPLPSALMTGSYQIKRDACRRGERFGRQRDGGSEKGEGGALGGQKSAL